MLLLILRKTYYSQPPFTEFCYVLFVMYYLSCATVLHAWPRVFLTEFWVASAALPYRWWHRGHPDNWAIHRSQRWVWGFLVVYSSTEGDSCHLKHTSQSTSACFCAVLWDSSFFSLYSSLDPVHSEHSFLHLEGVWQISIDREKVTGKQTLDCLESDNLDPRVN